MSKASANINFAKPSAFATVITGKQVKVIAGLPSDGPHTNGRQVIMGSAINWEEDDRFAVLVHECCHLNYPANYPAGNLRELANLIDDCRIERQFILNRPHYEAVLANLAINVIANNRYDEAGHEHAADAKNVRDPWSKENFDPSLWALLFFRPHCGDEVRLAASDSINAYVAEKKYEDQPGWKDKFASLVEEAQRITRLKTVSKDTLEKWCISYFDVFPEAKKSANVALATKILNDQPAPKGEQKDSEGGGDGEADSQIRIKSGAGRAGERPKERPEEDGEGEGGEEGDQEPQEGAQNDFKPQGGAQQPKEPKPSQNGSGGQKKNEQEGEAQQPADLEGALEKAKAKVGEVGRTKKAQAKEDAAGDSASAGMNGPDKNEEIEMPETDLSTVRGIGSEKGDVNVTKIADAVDRNFANRVKMSMRKLRTLVMDRVAGLRKTGRLHLPTVVAADRKGMLARKPFVNSIEEITDAPVACVVATDFSSSTSNINGLLNSFAHNALFALQAASCENAEVVWNTDATITKSLDEQVSAVRGNKHNSDGGTSLIACGTGCVKALLRAKSNRKVAFVFTDGAVYETEVPMLSKMLKDAGFEACLLVSLDEVVKHSGIVETVTCKNINDLIGIFDRWVRKQSAKAAQEQYA
jgi:hypothetical protein